MHLAVETVGLFVAALSLAGSLYTLLAAGVAGRFAAATEPSAPALPPVTLLKPLHFDAPGLEDDLETFLNQDYPAPVQIVFGVQSESDPAIAVVRHLIARHPGIDIRLVIDTRRYGSNAKICNLINMAEQAQHDVLILSDSDISVAPDYLRRVVAALEQPGVGAVTCPYTGKPGSSAWSTLAAMGTSYDFLPNVVFGSWWGIADACLGSTIALRRTTLSQIGGFEAFSDYLADDYEIGRAIRQRGLKVQVLPFAVAHRAQEDSFTALFAHELRWSRTVRVVRPASHLGTLVTFPFALALIALALLPGQVPALAAVAAAIFARLILKLRVDKAFPAASGPLWLLPVRDLVSFAVFLGSFLGQKVAWRGRHFEVETSGAMSQL
ncbi:MAG: bacteriohopanetetrol glucosamine biosynthesis glycosyltransferase HpnI [Proteobacteria bacterium]|nr:bacteriohopanetetrol glucosamine biosynthesis glycosyltransferase HpnI [Pseudomonadota bacterium]